MDGVSLIRPAISQDMGDQPETQIRVPAKFRRCVMIVLQCGLTRLFYFVQHVNKSLIITIWVDSGFPAFYLANGTAVNAYIASFVTKL